MTPSRVDKQLSEYRGKRKFSKTREPKGQSTPKSGGWSFVIQKHAATRLHYDLRLEMGGVLKSWALPKGPSLDPAEKRLAVGVEDHPLEYGDFEGTIPNDEYGGGTVIVWDQGTWSTEDDALEAYEAGKIKLTLHGHKLGGGWTLVRMKPRDGDNNWLFFKERDEAARPHDAYDIIKEAPESVLSGRVIEEVALAPERTWHSDKPKKSRSRKIGASNTTTSRATKRTSKKSKKKSSITVDGLAGAVKGPMPDSIEPQLAKLASEAPSDNRWFHEIKYDGYRLFCEIHEDGIVLRTRTGLDWTGRFPELAESVQDIPARTALLDGEVVSALPSGLSSFQGLQSSFAEKRTGQLVYYVFDLLYLDGYDIRNASLEARKSVLAELVKATSHNRIQYSDHLEGNGPDFLEQCCRMGLEGIICKRRDKPYRAGRQGDWLKVKCIEREEFVIGGFTDSTSTRKGLGALAIGYFDHAGQLHYAGRVGSGFSDRMLVDLRKRLVSIEIDRSPFTVTPRAPSGRGAYHWVRPVLVAQIEFSAWSRDGNLRHPVFQGLREDKPAASVVRDPVASKGDDQRGQREVKAKRGKAPQSLPAKSAVSAQSDKRQLAGLDNVQLTHPDRVLYPDAGITKLGLATFYAEIVDWVLPHVENRLLSLVRCPEGATKQCFFQKHAAAGTPDAIKRVKVQDKSGSSEHLAIDNLAGLISLVQMGILEIHPWGSRTDNLDKPDRIIFDLDPDPSVAWSRVVDGALELRARLEQLGLQSFVKTTGGKGLHIVVPIQRRHTWDEVKQFSRTIATEMAGDAPQNYTANPSKAVRKGRIYIDYARNGRGATAVAAYSTRAKENAAVSTPLAWDELSPALRSDHYHVGNLINRLSSLRRDPWEEIGKVKQGIRVAGM